MAEKLTLGQAFINIKPDLTGFTSALTKGTEGAVGAAADKLGGSLKALGGKLIKTFAIPLGIAIAANIAQFQALDNKLRETVTLFGSGGVDAVVTKQFNEMRDAVYEVSEAVGVLEQDVAGGLYQALSAGVPRPDVTDFLKTAQESAIAGNIDLLTSVDGLTTAMNAFEKDSLSAERAADIMFRGVARGKTTFDQLSTGMAKVAPLVASAGGSFEEMIAIVSTMTLSGTMTSEAYTGLRAAITGLLRPTEELNEIWKQAGFASGEAAIQSEGLQGAMGVVADAVDGSTSALIKLLGGAEAANAVLQVTGENAERFASVFTSTSESAGAMGQAYDTMSQGVGRAFGRLTASFDRLGNAGGQIASGFVVPIVDALTGAISTFADFTKAAVDAIKPVSDAFGQLVRLITGNRVFKTLVTALGAFAVALGVVGSALGLVTFAIGALISSTLGIGFFAKLSFATKGIVFFAGSLTKLGGAALTASTGLAKIPVVGGKIAASTTRMGTALTGLGSKLALNAGLWGGVAVAIAAVVAAYVILNKKHEEWFENSQVMTTQVDKLADSLGLVVTQIGNIDLSKLDVESVGLDFKFRAENIEVVREIEDILSSQGLEAGQDALFTIAMRFVALGNTPEEALEAVQKFVRATGINIPINFDVEDLTGEDALERQVEGFQSQLNRAVGQIQKLDAGEDFLGLSVAGDRLGNVLNVFDRGATIVEGRLKSVAQQAAETFSGDDLQPFLEYVKALDDTFEGAALDHVMDDVVKSMEDMVGTDFGVSLDNITDMSSLLEELRNTGIITQHEMLMATDAWYRAQQEGQAAHAANAAAFAASSGEIVQLTADEQAAFDKLAEGMASAMEDADAAVSEAQASIRGALLDQMPLLDIYGGAVEQSFSEWRKGQDAFQADLELWTSRSAEIMGMFPQDIRALLEQEPLDTKVWLANLGADDLETAVSELTESYKLVGTAAEDEFQRRLPDIVSEAQAELNTEYEEMSAEAAAAGLNVAKSFDDEFSDAAANWAVSARRAVDAAVVALQGGFQVKSPSKVMIDLARDVALGFSSEMDRQESAGAFNVMGGPPQDLGGQTIEVAMPLAPSGSPGAAGVTKNTFIEINNPMSQNADDQALEAAVIDRLAGVS